MVAVVASVLLSWPAFQDQVVSEVTRSGAWNSRQRRWFWAHLLAVVGVAGWIEIGNWPATASPVYGTMWFTTGGGLILVAFASWCLAFAPAQNWLNWMARSSGALAAGAVMGISVRVASHLTMELLSPLQHATLMTVELMLRALGQTTVLIPSKSVVGTASFTIVVADYCSGVEGIGLIGALTAIYLWLGRRELRFPRALALAPLGIAVIWVLNAVRLVALILIGGWSSEIAVDGFHSLAGWTFLIGTACGLVVVSRSESFFVAKPIAEGGTSLPNPAAPYLVPLLVTISVGAVTALFSPGLDFGCPLRVVAAAIALYGYRDKLRAFSWRCSPSTIALGTLAFAVWIAPDLGAGFSDIDRAFKSALDAMPPSHMAAWMSLRVLGAAVTVPIAEELAFRGYLLRKLVAPDFEPVPYGRFTWTSFVVSSLLFGILHQRWVVGTMAGMIFAAALYRRGRISEAIYAHATANAMLAVYVMATGHWSLWN